MARAFLVNFPWPVWNDTDKYKVLMAGKINNDYTWLKKKDGHKLDVYLLMFWKCVPSLKIRHCSLSAVFVIVRDKGFPPWPSLKCHVCPALKVWVARFNAIPYGYSKFLHVKNLGLFDLNFILFEFSCNYGQMLDFSAVIRGLLCLTLFSWSIWGDGIRAATFVRSFIVRLVGFGYI